MISPKAVSLIIRHFDAIDRVVAKRLVRKRPWGELALTSLFCDLLDEDTQREEGIDYSLSDLNNELAEMDGLLSVSFSVDTHEYDSSMERWVTQADLGLVVRFEDELLPSGSWSAAWLLQAKRLYPASREPVSYTEVSRFAATAPDQHARMEKLEQAVGLPFVRYLLYCPRPSLLDDATAAKLTHLRNRALGDHIFDYSLGLQLRDELSSGDSSLSAGVFVSASTDSPPNLGHVHASMLDAFFPFSWFLASHLVNDDSQFAHVYRRSAGDGRPRGNNSGPQSDRPDGAWAEGIVTGDSSAIERLSDALDEELQGPFPILPPHTLTAKISVGHDLGPDVRQIRHD